MKYPQFLLITAFGLLAPASTLAQEPQEQKVTDESSSIILDAQSLIDSIKPLPENANSMLSNLSRLLTSASLAKEVQKSQDQKVLAQYKKAIDYFNQAVDSQTEEVISKNLNMARLSMFSAAQLATPKKVSQNKHETDYKNKKSSVDSLLDAFSRIANEKEQNKENLQSTIDHITELEQEADKISATGDWKAAYQTLDQAYLLVKTSVQNLRQGDVLVKSLKFETKEEEYEYELDRNQTHFMLLKMLVQRKTNLSQYTKDKIAKFKADADELANTAEQQAHEEDFEAAISSLEASTKNLVRAIRVGGVFIPG